MSIAILIQMRRKSSAALTATARVGHWPWRCIRSGQSQAGHIASGSMYKPTPIDPGVWWRLPYRRTRRRETLCVSSGARQPRLGPPAVRDPGGPSLARALRALLRAGFGRILDECQLPPQNLPQRHPRPVQAPFREFDTFRFPLRFGQVEAAGPGFGYQDFQPRLYCLLHFDPPKWA